MHTSRTSFLATALLLCGTALMAQAHTAPAHTPVPASAPAPPAPNSNQVAATQRELIGLLRVSPTLTTVVSHDPSLLADQAYVSRNNPQLAEFLQMHPEVARNPEFYLFTHMHPEDASPDEALQRAVWPDVYRMQPRSTNFGEFIHDLGPLLAFACFLTALVWGVRLFVDSRRWSRTFKLQSDVHGRLIDKFSTSQELAAYMQTDAGRRFLEAAPIALRDNHRHVPNAIARVLTPLQVGTVLVLLGVGFLVLRHASPDFEIPMRVLGVLILMPGIGFLLSAGFTWLLAARLGLLPASPGQGRASFDADLNS